MTVTTNTGTREVPLKLAKELSAIANHEWECGSFMSKTTPVTQGLLFNMDSHKEPEVVVSAPSLKHTT